MSRQIMRYGLWFILLASVYLLAVWSLPMRLLLAHESRGGALWLVLVVGVGLCLLVAALNERLTHRHTSHQQQRQTANAAIIAGLGLFSAWLLSAEISDFCLHHFTRVHTPADRLGAVLLYATCCCLFFTQGLFRWLGQRRAQVGATR